MLNQLVLGDVCVKSGNRVSRKTLQALRVPSMPVSAKTMCTDPCGVEAVLSQSALKIVCASSPGVHR